MALLVMIPVAALTYGLMRVGISFNNERVGSVEDEQTLFLADAGIAESLLALRSGGTGNIGSQAAPVYYGRGLYWVEAAEVGNDLLLLRSTAMYEGGRRSIQTLAFRKYKNFRGMTIFSTQDLRVESQVFVDSFDSDLGNYADQVANGAGFVSDGAIVESNGNIQIDPSVELHGDAYPGPGDTVGIANSAYTSGTLQPNPTDRILDPVVVPVIPSSGTLTVTAGGGNGGGGNRGGGNGNGGGGNGGRGNGGGNPAGALNGNTLPAGDYNFDAINVNTGATLTITGPARVVVGDMQLDSNTNLVLDSASGPIEFFVSGNFVQDSNSSIDVTGTSATELTMNFTGGPDQLVELRSNSDFYGALYAPEATVSIFSNFEVFGAVVANSIILNANARIHYDEALKRGIADPPEYILATWSLVGFPVPEYLANRADPFRLVGIAPENLDLPEEGRELP